MIFRLVVIPITLFSGTFFPVEPAARSGVRPLAWISPLWHGTELGRAAALDRWQALPALGHLAYLVALLALGLVLSARFFDTAAGADERPSPPALPGSYAGRSRTLLLRSATASRRTWVAFVSGFFEPVFYLLALGPGPRARWSGRSTDQAARRSATRRSSRPGLLAASAMNGAVFDSTFNVFFKLKYARLYDAMLATPLGPVDIALGEIGWALIRGGLYALGFLSVIAGFGLLVSWWALLALPAALVIAFAFAAVGMAATSFMRSWQDFDLVHARDPADVPVLHHVLPDHRVPAVAAGRRRVPSALPRRGADARAHHRGGRAPAARPSGLFRGDDRGRGWCSPRGAWAALLLS